MPFDEIAYQKYFGRNPTKKVEKEKSRVFASEKSNTIHKKEIVTDKEYGQGMYRQVADDNIDDVEQLALLLKKLCNSAWGDDWGELSPDLKRGEDASKIILPQITVELNEKDIADGKPLKPQLTDIIKETDEEGNPTGDSFLIYRQWYDCIVEFNIYANTNQEARKIQKKFESLISVYTGYLKRNGVSEILFSKETSPKNSLNYNERVPMRCIYYYVRFESITSVRQSVINKINTSIGIGKLDENRVEQTLKQQGVSIQDPIDFDVFNG